jgi:hypothetical protein
VCFAVSLAVVIFGATDADIAAAKTAAVLGVVGEPAGPDSAVYGLQNSSKKITHFLTSFYLSQFQRQALNKDIQDGSWVQIKAASFSFPSTTV